MIFKQYYLKKEKNNQQKKTPMTISNQITVPWLLGGTTNVLVM